MSESPNLRDVQKRTLRLMNYEDGLWDMLLGMIFMLLAIYPVTRTRLGPAWNLALFVGLVLLVVAVQPIVRRQISTPRLGYVEANRSPALKVTLAITMSLVALTFGLVILTLVSPGWLPDLTPSAAPVWLRSYWVEVLVLIVMIGLFSGMGYLYGVPRLFLYGWLLGGGNLASVVINRGSPSGFNLPLGIAASVILLIGLGLLIRFVRKYPVRSLEA
jgi:hypothetical protein